jgi:phytoene dehydrogenase-like protein
MKVKSGDSKAFSDELGRLDGPSAEQDWKSLVAANFALGEVVAGVPPIALRADAGAVITARPYLGGLDPQTMLKFGLETVTKKISPSGPFSAVLDAANVGRGSLVYRWFDFLAFALSGLPVKATSAAACSFMMKEFFAPGAVLDYPLGGSQAIADALVRAIEKRGGTVELKKKVEGLVFDGNKCVGVSLQDGTQRTANVAVISNADAWATSNLVEKSLPQAKRAPKLEGETPLSLKATLQMRFRLEPGQFEDAGDAELRAPARRVQGRRLAGQGPWDAPHRRE